jgi:hypothetical protein
LALLGQLTDAFSPQGCSAKVARGMVKAGYGVFKVNTVGGSGGGASGTSMLAPGSVLQTPSPALTVDVDAIGSVASSGSIQTLTTFNGVVGLTEMQPARQVTFTCDASTDWDATNVTLTGVNHLGQTVSETLAIATSTTATSVNRYRSVTSVVIPVQTGAGGTGTIGISAVTALTIADFRGVAVRQETKTTNSTAGLYGYPGLTAAQLAVTADYVDGESVPCLYSGGIWCFTEEAVSDGDPVYVRIAAGAGGSALGAFRNDADTASCVLVVGARFTADCAAGLGRLRLTY